VPVPLASLPPAHNINVKFGKEDRYTSCAAFKM
jgi:hypothetical protein